MSMARTRISALFADTASFLEADITVCGWLRTVRGGKNLGFAELNDGSVFSSLQVVASLEQLENYVDAMKLPVGTAVFVTGKLVLTPDAAQPFELHASAISVIGSCPSDYPLQKKRHGMEFLRTMPHLRVRTNTFRAAFAVRSVAAQALHAFFKQEGFVYVHTPILTASDCEGAGEMFRATTLDPLKDIDASEDFFLKPSYLTVSGQLEAEAFASAFDRVYTFGPTFRAEKSNTARHATEFWMIEPEMAFCDLFADMDMAEGMIRFVLSYVLAHCEKELAFFNQFVDSTLLSRLQAVLSSDFARISYTEAIGILEPKNAQFDYPVSWGSDLQTEHERYLTEQVFQKPVFVHDYPKSIKPFYMRQNDDGRTVAACDLLVPGVGELIGGSSREERLDLLIGRMKECALDPENSSWYLDLRRFGSVPHAGFGLGFERLLMYLTSISNIRDVLPFPRTTGQMF